MLDDADAEADGVELADVTVGLGVDGTVPSPPLHAESTRAAAAKIGRMRLMLLVFRREIARF